MKKTLLLSVLLTFMVVGFFSCADDDDDATKGKLKIEVRKGSATGDLVTTADVGYATSKADLDNSNWIKVIGTDANGIADFGDVDAGTYYYDADATIGSDDYFGWDSGTVSAGGDGVLILVVTKQ